MTTSKTAIRRKIQALNDEQIIKILAEVSKVIHTHFYLFFMLYFKLIDFFLIILHREVFAATNELFIEMK